MTLAPTIQKYILHWGEMGARWGVNRTVAQIHALLFLSNRPLPAEEIADALAVARSNVSNSLKELQSWGLVRITHIAGDRRDHFVALRGCWIWANFPLSIVEESAKAPRSTPR
ncbi:MarR family protein [Duganella sp. HH101]|nr:MarR family protein [Duganella sp. HH101]